MVENLLDNARSKRMREPKLNIQVSLAETKNRLQLSVIDTGSAIQPEISECLFKEVVSSQDGFGIGLYQSYELAKNHDYDLMLDENIEGHICFSLKQQT